MPSYKTHSIHGEIIYSEIKHYVDINKEDLKTFCMGPDTLILTDYQLFDYQHANKTREYFFDLIHNIKSNHLLNHPEVISFLYGQLDHFILDVVMHPLIYYMTENFPKNNKINPHGLVEMWIDEYVMQQCKKENGAYYHKWLIHDSDLKKLIKNVYKDVYSTSREDKKYSVGIVSMNIFDYLVRRDFTHFFSFITSILHVGDLRYAGDIERVLPFLNLDKKFWHNPETNEEYYDSFDELWDKSLEISIDVLEEVNNCLFNDQPIHSSFLTDDISYNTGLPCENGQHLVYVKKYNYK